jgi:hypothetical protein
MVHGVRFVHIALRETSFLALSGLGAILFLNHQILYMTGDKPSSLSWLAYAASTAVIYAFIRGMFYVGGMRVPRTSEDPSVCPECGQPLADGTPATASMRKGGSPLPGSQARPTATALRVALARPIISSASAPIPEDVVNPSLDMLLQRLIDNPPAATLENPDAPRPDSVLGPTSQDDRRSSA